MNINKVKEYICSYESTEEIKLYDIANELGVSSSYLSQLIKKEYGKNFHEFVYDIKYDSSNMNNYYNNVTSILINNNKEVIKDCSNLIRSLKVISIIPNEEYYLQIMYIQKLCNKLGIKLIMSSVIDCNIIAIDLGTKDILKLSYEEKDYIIKNNFEVVVPIDDGILRDILFINLLFR